MISTIPIYRILPIGMSTAASTKTLNNNHDNDNISTGIKNDNIDDIANRAAFYGDKVLNYYISQVIRQEQQQQQQSSLSASASTSPISVMYQNDDVVIGNRLIPGTEYAASIADNNNNNHNQHIVSTYSGIDLGYVTLVQGEAMSNQLYSNVFVEIMGSHPHVTPEIIQRAQEQVHDAGTMVEAAVDAIMNLPQQPPSTTTINTTFTQKDSVAAVQELATYLVHHAYATTTYFNAKGQLLELGGTVISFKTEDSVLHTPKYRAIATFRGMSHLSDPPSSTKKMAEQMAATHLLLQCQQLRKQPVHKQRITFADTNNDNNYNMDETADMNGDMTPMDTATAANAAGEVNVVPFDADLMEDGTLPDDFYSDITAIARQRKKNKAGNKNRKHNEDDDDDDDDDESLGRPFDAQRFQLPKLIKREQCDFYHFNNTHTVNLHSRESPEMSWRRGAYDKRSCFHRAILSSKMLPQHVETVNSWTRPNGKDFFTVVVVLVPKQKPEDFQKSVFPTVKCFVRHDESRNRARNALGLVVNQYIDQVIIGSNMEEIKKAQFLAPVQPDRKLWPPSDVRKKNKKPTNLLRFEDQNRNSSTNQPQRDTNREYSDDENEEHNQSNTEYDTDIDDHRHDTNEREDYNQTDFHTRNTKPTEDRLVVETEHDSWYNDTSNSMDDASFDTTNDTKFDVNTKDVKEDRERRQ